MPINRPNVFSQGSATATDLQIDSSLRLLGSQFRMHTISGTISGLTLTKYIPMAYQAVERFPFTAIQAVKSTDATDIATTGSGARSIFIEGVSTLGNLVSESVALNGTTEVALSNSYNWINHMAVTESGSADVNNGDIEFGPTGFGTTYLTAEAKTGALLTASLAYPQGTRAIVMDYSINLAATSSNSNVDIAVGLSPLGDKRAFVAQMNELIGVGTFPNPNLTFTGTLNQNYKNGVAGNNGGLVQFLVNPNSTTAAIDASVVANVLVYTPS